MTEEMSLQAFAEHMQWWHQSDTHAAECSTTGKWPLEKLGR